MVALGSVAQSTRIMVWNLKEFGEDAKLSNTSEVNSLIGGLGKLKNVDTLKGFQSYLIYSVETFCKKHPYSDNQSAWGAANTLNKAKVQWNLYKPLLNVAALGKSLSEIKTLIQTDTERQTDIAKAIEGINDDNNSYQEVVKCIAKELIKQSEYRTDESIHPLDISAVKIHLDMLQWILALRSKPLNEAVFVGQQIKRLHLRFRALQANTDNSIIDTIVKVNPDILVIVEVQGGQGDNEEEPLKGPGKWEVILLTRWLNKLTKRKFRLVPPIRLASNAAKKDLFGIAVLYDSEKLDFEGPASWQDRKPSTKQLGLCPDQDYRNMLPVLEKDGNQFQYSGQSLFMDKDKPESPIALNNTSVRSPWLTQFREKLPSGAQGYKIKLLSVHVHVKEDAKADVMGQLRRIADMQLNEPDTIYVVTGDFNIIINPSNPTTEEGEFLRLYNNFLDKTKQEGREYTLLIHPNAVGSINDRWKLITSWDRALDRPRTIENNLPSQKSIHKAFLKHSEDNALVYSPRYGPNAFKVMVVNRFTGSSWLTATRQLLGYGANNFIKSTAGPGSIPSLLSDTIIDKIRSETAQTFSKDELRNIAKQLKKAYSPSDHLPIVFEV